MSKSIEIGQAAKEGYIPLTIGRVSTSEQRLGLDDQMKQLEKDAKRFGFKKKPVSKAVQQSGFDGELETIDFVKEQVAKNPKKKFVVVVQDISRIARDTERSLTIKRELNELGVPIIETQTGLIYSGTGKDADELQKAIYTMRAMFAEFGKGTEFKARERGTQQAAKRGLVEGVPRNLYLDYYKRRKVSVYRQISNALQAIDAGLMSGRELTKTLGINDAQRRKIQKLLTEMDDRTRKEYLDVVDAILEQEKRKKVGRRDVAKRLRTREATALHRVTVGYLQFPDKFPNPLTTGNPEIAEQTGFVGDGTIADAIENPQKYQPRR